MGADWALLQPDGSARVDARCLHRMQDGTFVAIRNRGHARPAPGRDNVYTGQSTPVFEAPQGSPTRSDLSQGDVTLNLYQIEPGPTPQGTGKTRRTAIPGRPLGRLPERTCPARRGPPQTTIDEEDKEP